MKLHRKYVATLLVASAVWAFGQRTVIFQEPNLSARNSEFLFEERVYGGVMRQSADYIQYQQPASSVEYPVLKQLQNLLGVKSAIRLDLPDSEKLLTDFIRTHSPDSMTEGLLYEAGSYFFEKGDYAKGIDYLEKVDPNSLSNNELVAWKFKRAYSYFVKKQWAKSRPIFKEIKGVKESPYHHPTNYYYGLSAFFQNDYSEALTGFKAAEGAEQYKTVVPYPILQIYFAQKNYDEVINYGTKLAADTKQKNSPEINQLVGQAYFEKKKYKEALPFFETYSSKTSKLTEKDFYQIAYTQYQVGAYSKAITNFEELKTQQNALGQNALYHLGDCYIKTNNLVSARSAFAAASAMNFNPSIQQSALLYYAKLSYQLGDDREALRVLQTIPETSPDYTESQNILAGVLERMSDYQTALNVINKMPKKDLKVRQVYQKISYNRGVELMQQGDNALAKTRFIEAIREPHDPYTKALATYWVAEINTQEKQYDEALQDFAEFNLLANNFSGMPEESSVATANYQMGYIYMSRLNYATAIKHFQKTIDELRPNIASTNNVAVKQRIYPEAMLMAADCHFKLKSYNNADELYQTIIRNNYPQADYAMLQQAQIYATKQDPLSEIAALDKMMRTYPNSAYYDLALFRKGQTLVLSDAPQADIIANYKKLLTNYPKSIYYNRTLLKLGSYYDGIDQKDLALEHYKQVMTHQPTKDEALDARNGIENIYLDKGDETGYLTYLNSLPGGSAQNIDEDNLLYRATVNLYDKGNYKDATIKADNYLNRFPKGFNYWSTLTIRADCNYQLKKYEEAAADYELLLKQEKDSNYEYNLERAASLYFNYNKNYAKAYSLYEKLIEEASETRTKTLALLGKTRCAYQLKKYDETTNTAKAALAQTDLTNSQQAECHYYLAKIALNKKDYAVAQNHLKKVTELSSDAKTAEARYLLARIAYEKRELDDAENLCLEASSEIPEAYQDWTVRTLLLLSDVYAEQNQLLNAKVALNSIIEDYTGDAALLKEAKDKLNKIKEAEKTGSRIKANTKTNDLEMDGGN